MTFIYSPDNLQTIDETLTDQLGGKGMALFNLYKAGLPVPKPICIGTEGYDLFLEANQLRERINLELHRKALREMRWEEIWDVSLRIQNLFLNGLIPAELCDEIKERVFEQFADRPLVIRSSAPDEDDHTRSFAGLHESYVNIVGANEILKKIKKVWASLWSDRAILYRQELGLEISSSKMAVVVQELIEGETSGLLFTSSPLDNSLLLVEAVYGLNQGLVDGDIEPDRWTLDRSKGSIVAHSVPAKRHFHVVRSLPTGIERRTIDETAQALPPINETQVKKIAALGMSLEKFFGSGQDIEWTIESGKLYLLQSRPITVTSSADSTDKRSWYLSLHRSYENLLQLWKNITEDLLPKMDRESKELADTVLEEFSDRELADEIERRSAVKDRWVKIYWSDFIPFAHGVRLFGEWYNDIVEPDDPFEFVSLLTGQNMLSTQRNAMLYECAAMVRRNKSLRVSLEKGTPEETKEEKFRLQLSRLKADFSMDGVATGGEEATNQLLSSIILQYARLDTLPQDQAAKDTSQLLTQFYRKSDGKLPVDPRELLELARASYRIRDNDNIHIGRIGQELQRAMTSARNRLIKHSFSTAVDSSVKDLCQFLRGDKQARKAQAPPPAPSPKMSENRVQARQLLGQPASRGLAKGKARVVVASDELKDFQKGEVLVIESIDPTMTFFAPLAAGIIERRGGMLIHGAIIAREYGIPCITGVVDATSAIQTGDMVTVDAYLGICTVQRSAEF